MYRSLLCITAFAILFGTQDAHADGVPVIGEMKLYAGDSAPKGWTFCHGQELSIESNEYLFYTLHNRFGGDGRAIFGLPDLRKFERLLGKTTGNKFRYIIAFTGTFPFKREKAVDSIGEIRIFAGRPQFLPTNWRFCEGQKLSPKLYPALAHILRDKDKRPLYGSVGQLPDLRNVEQRMREVTGMKHVPRFAIVVDGVYPRQK